MEERRNQLRQRCYFEANLLLDAYTTMSGKARNISDGGAMLTDLDGLRLPQAFKIEFPARRETVEARTVWREKERAGLRFGRRTRSVA